jgi:Fe-S-cluster containining protein
MTNTKACLLHGARATICRTFRLMLSADKHNSVIRVYRHLKLRTIAHKSLRRCLRLRQNPPACAPWGGSVTLIGSLISSDRA